MSSTSQKLDWFGTIRARLGIAANNWLFYGTAGGAYGHVEYSYAQSDLVNISGSNSTTQWGWTAGAGVEYGWDKWSLRAEYLYMNLGNHSLTVPLGLGTAGVFFPNFENKYNIVRAALNYRF